MHSLPPVYAVAAAGALVAVGLVASGWSRLRCTRADVTWVPCVRRLTRMS